MSTSVKKARMRFRRIPSPLDTWILSLQRSDHVPPPLGGFIGLGSIFESFSGRQGGSTVHCDEACFLAYIYNLLLFLYVHTCSRPNPVSRHDRSLFITVRLYMYAQEEHWLYYYYNIHDDCSGSWESSERGWGSVNLIVKGHDRVPRR
jgi:hypothetical protein